MDLGLGPDLDEPQPDQPRQREQHLDAQARAPLEQPEQVRLEQAQQRPVGRRARGSRPDDLVEQRDLAEKVSVAEADELAARRLALDRDRAACDDVHPEAGLALDEHGLAGHVVAAVEQALDGVDLARRQVLEERDRREEVVLGVVVGPAEQARPEALHRVRDGGSRPSVRAEAAG